MKSCLCASAVVVVCVLVLHPSQSLCFVEFEIFILTLNFFIFSDVVRWCLVYLFGVIMRYEEQDIPFRYLF